MTRLFAAVSLLLTLLPATSQAMECDNFTARDHVVPDSLEALDTYTNYQLFRAMSVANHWSRNGECNRKLLFKELEAKLAGIGMGRIEKWAEKSKDVVKLQEQIDLSDYIYKGASFWRLPLMEISGVAHSIRLAGFVVGTDKLGHFMAEGLKYYELTQGKDGSLNKALLWGIRSEEGIFGLDVSDVKSYADLSANFAGLSFWQNIVDGDDPYFECVDGGQYRRRRLFSWYHFVSAAWDEGINCSLFENYMGDIFTANLAERGLTCPVQGSEVTCQRLSQLPHAASFVSPVCMNMPATGDYVFDPKALYFVPGRRGD